MAGIAIFIFLGLIFGSFANLVLFRFHTGEPIIFTRSKCLSCGRTLSWLELIPVFSFIIQKGKCRNCSANISFQYPAVEIASGFLFLFVWLNFSGRLELDMWISLALSAVFWFSLFLASVYDLKHKILPDEFILIAGIAAFSKYLFLTNGKFESNAILASIFAFLFFAFIWLLSRGKAMGLGDAKMAGVLGLFLGFPKIALSLIFSFWLGAVFGISLIILKKAALKTAVPFGPFIFIGAFLSWFLNLRFLESWISLW